MNIQEIKNNRTIANIIKDKMLIASITGIIVFWSMIYLVTFYKPDYNSMAKVWIKNIPDQNFVSNENNINTQNENQSLTTSSNPLLTQLEIIKSRQMADYILAYIDKKYPGLIPNTGNREEAVLKAISCKNKTAGSDLIDISFKWNNPKQSQEFLGELLKEYENINLLINRKIKTQSRVYIDSKVAEIGDKLLKIREQIRAYKVGTLAIDIDQESNSLVKQKLDFISQEKNTDNSINDAQAKIKEIEQKLSLNSRDAINAVALGSSNQNLVKLRQDLNDAVQQYASDTIKMSDTNPKMIALANKINTIKHEIQSQIKLSIGNSIKKQPVNIYDPVRESMVKDLADYQTNLMGLKAQKASIENGIKGINSLQSVIPGKKFTLENLEQEEKNLSLAYDELRVKQIEARIKEAEIVSNISIVESPNFPIKQSFPKPLHIILLALILGGLLGVTSSVLKTYIEDICEGSKAIEEITGRPVLGIIPWLEDPEDADSRSVIDFSMKNILSNMIISSYKNNAKVLTFTSTHTKRQKSSSVEMLALNLRKMGHSVVVIDADLKAPAIFKNLTSVENKGVNLSDLILQVESKIKHGEGITPDFIMNMLYKCDDGIYFLGNNTSIEFSYEYIGTTAFKVIIDILKAHFDWVLIDISSINIAPEFKIISKLSDAVVLFANYKVTYSVLSRFVNTLKISEIPLLGTVIREQNSILEKDFEEYKNRLNIIDVLAPAKAKEAEELLNESN